MPAGHRELRLKKITGAESQPAASCSRTLSSRAQRWITCQESAPPELLAWVDLATGCNHGARSLKQECDPGVPATHGGLG